LIPDYAMSAGTVLALSGDAIHMDYYSVLGPIDPQVRRGNSGGFVSALGYLEQYNRLIEKSKQAALTDAEINYLCDKFDPGELYEYEQARELSIDLLKKWLVDYKFKNWTTTAGRKLPVTREIKEERATLIASLLNDTRRWHSEAIR